MTEEMLLDHIATIMEKHLDFDKDDEQALLAAKDWLISHEAEEILLDILADLYKAFPGTYKSVKLKITGRFKGSFQTTLNDVIDKKIKTILLRRKAHEVKDYFDDDFDLAKLPTNKTGAIYPTAENLRYILSHLRNFSIHLDRMTKRVWLELPNPWDVLSEEKILTIFKMPDYVWKDGDPEHWKPKDLQLSPTSTTPVILRQFVPFDDGELESLKVLLSGTIMPYEVPWVGLRAACHLLAEENPIDIYSYWSHHGAPQWDGINRDDWLVHIAGADDSTPDLQHWNRIGGRMIPYAIHCRARVPGIHFRLLFILEGKQNIGKDRLIKALCFHPDFYISISLDGNFRETRREFRGRAVVVLPELVGLDSRDQREVKKLISDEFDEQRGMHVDKFSRWQRRNVLFGTFNQDEGGIEYLTDSTGNTRYCVYHLLASEINVELAERVLPQVFAQAVHDIEQHGEQPWLTKDEEQLQARMNARVERTTRIQDYCAEFVKTQGINGIKNFYFVQGLKSDDIIEFIRRVTERSRIYENRSNKSFYGQIAKGMRATGHDTLNVNADHPYRDWKSGNYWVPKECLDHMKYHKRWQFDLYDDGWRPRTTTPGVDTSEEQEPESSPNADSPTVF
jgi:hypothetical protein